MMNWNDNQMTWKEMLKVYWLIYLYILAFFYVIIRAMICDCAIATEDEAILIMVITLAVFFITYYNYKRWVKKQIKKDE